MRLFVAIELSDTLRQIAIAGADTIRDSLGSAIVARWTPPENLHITVRFIGQVADDRATQVIQTLIAPIPLEPFDISFGRCGVFPRSGPPRVIWIGLGEGAAPCAALHDELERRLAPLGFAAEDRPFSAHLTLARVKEVRRAAGASVRRSVAAFDPARDRCRVAHATVFESQLSRSGSRYTPVHRIDFAT